jgi:tryptophan-rich sensory protein
MKDDFRLANYFIAYVATLLFFGVGAITTLGLDWYGTLTLPAFMPPTVLVAAVWCALFILAAWSACIVWDTAAHTDGFRATVALYLANALLVLLWNYLFFGVHVLSAAGGAAVLVGFSVAWLMTRVRRTSRRAAYLLAPYLLWVLAALYLNYLIWSLNA